MFSPLLLKIERQTISYPSLWYTRKSIHQQNLYPLWIYRRNLQSWLFYLEYQTVQTSVLLNNLWNNIKLHFWILKAAETFISKNNWWPFCFFVCLNWIVVDSFLSNLQTGPLILKSCFPFARFFSSLEASPLPEFIICNCYLKWEILIRLVFLYSQQEIRMNNKHVKVLETGFWNFFLENFFPFIFVFHYFLKKLFFKS